MCSQHFLFVKNMILFIFLFVINFENMEYFPSIQNYTLLCVGLLHKPPVIYVQICGVMCQNVGKFNWREY